MQEWYSSAARALGFVPPSTRFAILIVFSFCFVCQLCDEKQGLKSVQVTQGRDRALHIAADPLNSRAGPQPLHKLPRYGVTKGPLVLSGSALFALLQLQCKYPGSGIDRTPVERKKGIKPANLTRRHDFGIPSLIQAQPIHAGLQRWLQVSSRHDSQLPRMLDRWAQRWPDQITG